MHIQCNNIFICTHYSRCWSANLFTTHGVPVGWNKTNNGIIEVLISGNSGDSSGNWIRGIGSTIWLWLTVRHGKSQPSMEVLMLGKSSISMGHGFLGELLVITRGFNICLCQDCQVPGNIPRTYGPMNSFFNGIFTNELELVGEIYHEINPYFSS